MLDQTSSCDGTSSAGVRTKMAFDETIIRQLFCWRFYSTYLILMVSGSSVNHQSSSLARSFLLDSLSLLSLLVIRAGQGNVVEVDRRNLAPLSRGLAELCGGVRSSFVLEPQGSPRNSSVVIHKLTPNDRTAFEHHPFQSISKLHCIIYYTERYTSP